MEVSEDFTALPVTDPSTLPCNHCNRRFASRLRLDQHLKYATSSRAFACPVKDCGRVFVTKSHVTEHMNLHFGNRPFPCTFPGCSYRGKTGSQLAQHRATHGLGYVYACDYCDYQATTSSNLRRHARLHMDTRPYRCPHCPHTFVELSALRRHVLDSAYHPGLPLYVCPWCNRRSEATTSAASLPPNSLIINSPISNGPADIGVCGFNSSTLAWKHVVQAHAEQLASAETLQRLEKKPGETLIEHDVSLIFGLYHPSEDGKFRPSSAVRQFNSVATIRTHQRMRSSTKKRTNNKSHHAASGIAPALSPSVMDVTAQTSISDAAATATNSEEGLKFVQMQDLVALPGGVLWSASTFRSELVRATGGHLHYQQQPLS
uniref:Zinc finger, C2H2 type n=1 Tax=Mesocestoides corti TaxID=53468 RepID=A0A5K3FF28_MESCO